jgi:hypothetical protein
MTETPADDPKLIEMTPDDLKSDPVLSAIEMKAKKQSERKQRGRIRRRRKRSLNPTSVF